MKGRIYPLLLIIILAATIHKVRAQQKTHFIIDSLKRQLSSKKTAKDSLYVIQQLADNSDPIDAISLFGKPDYFKRLLDANKRLNLIDDAPYRLLEQAVALNNAGQYKQELAIIQSAIHAFDKQHKIIIALLMYTRLLYNKTNDQEGRFKFYTEKLEYYQVNGPVENTAACYHGLGGYYNYKAIYNLAINNYLKGGEVFRKFDPPFYANALTVTANMYKLWGNDDKAMYYERLGLPLQLKTNDSLDVAFSYYGIALIDIDRNKYDQAIIHIDSALRYGAADAEELSTYLTSKADAYLKAKQPALAWPIIRKAKTIIDSGSYPLVNTTGDNEIDYMLYEYYLQTGHMADAEKYLLTAQKKATDANNSRLELKYLEELGNFYLAQNKRDLALRYFSQYLGLAHLHEKNLNEYKVAQFEIDQNDKQQRDHITKLKQEKEIQDYQISRRNNLLRGAGVILLLILGLLIFIYRQLNINKKILSALRQTQTQLIQSEKMASLGELTAGIAHEIQNPLNFVNNFSEVNQEMVDELKIELEAGNLEEALSIAADIKENEAKINHHGKRADFIVKGMLQHSRNSTGEKQLTNINVLADEFFKLSYHGLRAKNKNFNAELITRFDENLPKVNIAQQDIGRVLLNLFNNAFYAVNEKQKTAGPDFKPTVELSTFAPPSGGWGITVRDNGNGIPENIKDKIMQPFFTTKPTGEGTGLGLSLSYDIIVKGHGGSITVDTKEGEFTTFTINLPYHI